MRPSVHCTGGLFTIYYRNKNSHLGEKKCVHKETNNAKMNIALVIHVHAQKNNVAVNNY